MIELGINRGPSKNPPKAETVAERVAKEEQKERIRIPESQFYNTHYQGIADTRNKKGRAIAVTAEDVKREFDQLRKEDAQARQHPEFKEWKPGLDLAFDHLRLLRDKPESEEAKKQHIGILNIGGGMMGSKGAGNVAGLNEMGFNAKLFDVLAGISAGAANLIYFAGGKLHTLRGAAIYYTQCASKKFINLARLPHVMKSTVITDAMKEGPQAVDEDAVRGNARQLWAGITPKGDPKMPMEWADALHSRPGMIPVVGASINVPILFAPGIEVNTGGGTVEYIDGAFGELPIEEFKEKFPHITDLIVITNTHFERLEDFKPSGEWVKKLKRAGSIGTIRKFYQLADEKRKLIGYYKKEKDLNVAMLWSPKTPVGSMSNDPDEVVISYYDTIKDTILQAREKLPKTVEIYDAVHDKYLEIEIGV